MDDRTRVEELLGRPPRADFDVVVPDDAGDPTMRVNILVALCDLSVLACIRQTPLLRSQLLHQV